MAATLAAARRFASADEFFTLLGDSAREDVTALVRDGRILAHVSGLGMVDGQLVEAIKAHLPARCVLDAEIVATVAVASENFHRTLLAGYADRAGPIDAQAKASNFR